MRSGGAALAGYLLGFDSVLEQLSVIDVLQ
jgi:hypothetical protein